MTAEHATPPRDAEAAAVVLLRQATAQLVAAAGDDRALVHLMETARQVSAGAFDAGGALARAEGG